MRALRCTRVMVVGEGALADGTLVPTNVLLDIGEVFSGVIDWLAISASTHYRYQIFLSKISPSFDDSHSMIRRGHRGEKTR